MSERRIIHEGKLSSQTVSVNEDSPNSYFVRQSKTSTAVSTIVVGTDDKQASVESILAICVDQIERSEPTKLNIEIRSHMVVALNKLVKLESVT